MARVIRRTGWSLRLAARPALLSLLLGLPGIAAAEPRWQTLPPMPAPVSGLHSGHVQNKGASIYYATLGSGSPVILLHGGLGSSDWLLDQARMLAPEHEIILIDSRGQGRSTAGTLPLSYDLMTDDVVAVLGALKLDKAAVVGWSDGAIIGIDLALHHPDRVTRVFAFGANTLPEGNNPDGGKSAVVQDSFNRSKAEYAEISPTPGAFDEMKNRVVTMWNTQPHWPAAVLATIKTPICIADGDHDELILQSHTIAIAHQIPNATLELIPDSSHFAFLQAPELFHASVVDFLNKP